MLPVLALLAACDARTPTGSTSTSAPAPARPRTEVTTPTTIGSSSVDIPFDNRASMGWTPSDIPVNADSGKWIVVRVEGFVYDTYNGQCDDLREHAGTGGSTILCPPDPGHVTAWGPLSSGGSGGVDVALQRGPVTPIASGAVPGALLAMYPPPGADGSVAEVLLNVHGTYNVWTHRRMNVSGGGTTFGGSNIEFGAFFLGGSQTVSVLEVPNPVKVSGPTAVTRGDSVTFTAQLTGNYTPRTAAGGQAGPFWYFHYNDTTAVPNPATFYEPVDECHGSMTCRIRADRPGRMYVTEFVETQQAQAHSEPVTLQQAKSTLSCNGHADTVSIERGKRISCTVSAAPTTATLVINEWTFDGEGSRIHPDSGEEHAPAWEGVMVVPGTISVNARINDQSFSASVAVTVTPRRWTGKINTGPQPAAEYVGGPGTPLRYPPSSPDDPDLKDGVLGQFESPDPSISLDEGSGPNRGWVFLLDPPELELGSIHIWVNKALLPGDPFYQAQTGRDGPDVIHNGRPSCGQQFMQAAANFVYPHEVGHFLIFQSYWSDPTVAAALERRRIFDPENLQTARTFAATQMLDSLAGLKAKQDDYDAHHKLSVPCDLNPLPK